MSRSASRGLAEGLFSLFDFGYCGTRLVQRHGQYSDQLLGLVAPLFSLLWGLNSLTPISRTHEHAACVRYRVVSHEAVVSLGDGIEISKRPEAAGREPS